MGLDACMWFKLKPGVTLDAVARSLRLPEDWSVDRPPAEDAWKYEGVPDIDRIVEVDCWAERYFCVGSSRGSWESIGSVLGQLMFHPLVESVWYASDMVDPDAVLNSPPFTPADFDALAAHAAMLAEARK